MTLSAVTRGRVAAPLRVLLYGVEGIGKSTFGAGAPDPIFLGAEDGTGHLDVARFPQPETFQEALDAVRALERDPHEFRSLVVDTIDWLEPMIWKKVCGSDLGNIEDFGYGKGYVKALDEWRVFLAALERMRAARKMHVILLGHSFVKAFKNPEGDDYDRYQLKVHDKAGGLVKEWCDVVLFANYDVMIKKESKKATKGKGIDTGVRYVYTNRRAAFDAKNRYGLPDELPLSWEDFWTAVQARQPADPVKLRQTIQDLAAGSGNEDLIKKVTAYLAQAGNDAEALAQIYNGLRAKLGPQTEE